MLEKTVSALKADKAKTLDLINEGKGGFLDRDLYPFCFNLSDGKNVAVASPNSKQVKGLGTENSLGILVLIYRFDFDSQVLAREVVGCTGLTACTCGTRHTFLELIWWVRVAHCAWLSFRSFPYFNGNRRRL
jgi:hypothetical protein